MRLFKRRDRDATGAAAASFALLAMMLGLLRVRGRGARRQPRRSACPAGAVQVTLSEFAITPASISAPLNGKLVVANSGSAVTTSHVSGTKIATKDLQPGSSATVDLKGLKAGTYTVFCAISGHQQAGMQATLVIGGSGAARARAQDGEHGLQQHDARSSWRR